MFLLSPSIKYNVDQFLPILQLGLHNGTVEFQIFIISVTRERREKKKKQK